MNKDNSASRLAPRGHIRAPPNSATAQLFRARRQHGQVGEVATLPSRCLARTMRYLFHTRDTGAPGQEGRERSPSSDKRRAPSCAADWLLNSASNCGGPTENRARASTRNGNVAVEIIASETDLQRYEMPRTTAAALVDQNKISFL